MTDAPTPDAAQQRRFGLLLLTIAALLAALFVTFALWTTQLWMLAFLVLVVPNVVIGVRELRASRVTSRDDG